MRLCGEGRGGGWVFLDPNESRTTRDSMWYKRIHMNGTISTSAHSHLAFHPVVGIRKPISSLEWKEHGILYSAHSILIMFRCIEFSPLLRKHILLHEWTCRLTISSLLGALTQHVKSFPLLATAHHSQSYGSVWSSRPLSCAGAHSSLGTSHLFAPPLPYSNMEPVSAVYDLTSLPILLTADIQTFLNARFACIFALNARELI